ncbi:C25 family cysteine peptidase [Candidatus Viridilinea mediisalina]|uniref:Gingipain domain-containing protein n=1 Tax=Candidatus Viridilinea mediisalina TaxID=2024553 RepID=A0A2A6RMU1_9CHLR|nr:C25 family cysteine peptidase [Candidatus Viridilinea mediisalina]PDW04382.1 hypothetical protein CJ255_03715 [Candidatus Viridilinea mediisalina]
MSMRIFLVVTLLFTLIASLPTQAVRANHAALVVTVTAHGMQRMSAQDLIAAGFDPALDPTRLWLRHGDQVVPLELIGAGARLDATTELRFYAPPPGDRWNLASFYRLSLEAEPAPQMAIMPPVVVAEDELEERTTAYERGTIYQPRIYDSRRPGPDGDRWFSVDLRADAEGDGEASFTLEPLLPVASGPTTLTIQAQVYVGTAMRLTLNLGPNASAVLTPTMGLWTGTVALADEHGSEGLDITLYSPMSAAGVLLDRIVWERPAMLQFNQRGALFRGAEGAWRYQLAGLPAGAALYIISDPAAPLRIPLEAGRFVAGPEVHDYLLAGPGTLHRPALRPWQAGDLLNPRQADALYLAPAAWHATLEPLLALRTTQGLRVHAVSLEAIYEQWSNGAVDPEAIRSFVAQSATWPTPPQSIVLVGDGTSDPHDWSERGPNNLNILPPYLAVVDPWLGEAACDTCYARIATADPRDDPLPAMAVGRLPVKSQAELEALVDKLIGYDQAPAEGRWRGTIAMIADDPDTAGDFAAEANRMAATFPTDMHVRRVFYDPTGTFGIASANEAHAKTMAAFNDGAALLVYTGHSHPWQWAITDVDSEFSWLLSLYEPDALTNHERLPVVLAMTCLSSAFARPAISGTTVDERLLLARGGAVAVWGPTGMGVLYGHDRLQRGFFDALWAVPPGEATLGSLTLAGLQELHRSGSGIGGPLFTYVLLGDPLTRVRYQGGYDTWLPLVAR